MERLSSPEETIKAVIERWKKGPVILASSSEFRRNKLNEMGFVDVELISDIPEETEIKTSNAINKDSVFFSTSLDSDGRRHSEHIASAKVDYVLQNKHIDPETLVIAFDTTAVIYGADTDEQIMGTPQSSEKFVNIESARENMIRRFKILLLGMLERESLIGRYRQGQEEIGGSETEINETLSALEIGIRKGIIYINTGVAIAFPNSHNVISRSTDEVRLFSEAVKRSAGDERALEELIDLIINTQGVQKTLSISGGIDYADNAVRDILDLKEQPEISNNRDVYRGFTTDALNVLLYSEASKLLNITNT